MKDEKTEPTKLLQELIRLDRYLESRQTRFLCGDQMTFADCELLPKLQHIRVAVKVGCCLSCCQSRCKGKTFLTIYM